jgi:hypothetical protein
LANNKSYQTVNPLSEICKVSEQKSEQTGDAVTAGPTAVNPADATPAATPQDAPKDAVSVESPKPAPERGAADKAQDAPKIETNPEARAEAAKPASQILIMPRDQAWNGGADQAAQGDKPGILGKHRLAALAAVIALAAIAGAVGGALATAGLGHVAGAQTRTADNHALEDSISRIDTEIAALRTSFEQASKHTASQLGKSSDRLDRIEKAQAEPAAKLARLSETVEKLRTAAAAPAPVAAASVAPKETTASVQTANAAPGPVPVPAPKPEVARLPTVEGWVLRDVANGGALIEGRQGIFEVYAGDPIPGLGRVDAIRKQDGRWVVVTSRGLIVGR